MNFQVIWDGVTHAISALLSSWAFKMLGAAVLAVIYHKQAVLFYCFTILVFLDCFTRWMAISHDRLAGEGVPEENITVVKVIKGIKKARADGLISSEVMKHRFIGKIIIYLICVLAAATTDLMMKDIEQAAWAVTTVVGYLTMTELLSIIENLNAAGIETLNGLLAIIKRKKAA